MVSKKRIEIPVVRLKFCGGCNPRYDRLAAAHTIMQAVEGVVQFSCHTDQVFCAALVIAGCPTCCVEDVDCFHLPVFRLTDDEAIPQIVEKILQYVT